jgi:hypothetical protein
VNEVPFESMQRAFSTNRVNLFTQAASSPTKANAWAMALWNGKVSAALWGEIGMAEVVVRNAIHRELTKLAQRETESSEWFHQLARLGIDGAAADRVRDTLAQLDTDRKAHTPGYVVAGLSFGFWGRVLAASDAESLWRRQLHRAFPRGTVHHDVAHAMRTVHDLRNRIAHHRPICKGTPAANIAELFTALAAIRNLVSWTAPDLAGHLHTYGIEDLIHARP